MKAVLASSGLFPLLFSLGLLLTGCSFHGVSISTNISGQGTLFGIVVAGPTCPVETPSGRGGPRPVAGKQVQIETPGGTLVTTTTTDQEGHFSIMLPREITWFWSNP